MSSSFSVRSIASAARRRCSSRSGWLSSIAVDSRASRASEPVYVLVAATPISSPAPMSSGYSAACASSESGSLVMQAVSAPASRARRTTAITSVAAPDCEMPSTSAFGPKCGTVS